MEVACLLCEFGIIICTLLDIFSIRHPGNPQGDSATDNAEMAIAFGSLLFTIGGMLFVLIRSAHTVREVRKIWKAIGFTVIVLHSQPTGHVAVAPIAEDDDAECAATKHGP